MRRILVLSLIFSLILTAPAIAQAGSKIGFLGWGPRAGLTVNPDQIHFGAHVSFGAPTTPLLIQPNVELGFGDDVTLIAINGDMSYLFRSANGAWTPSLGGELGMVRVNVDGFGSNTDLGISIFGAIAKTMANGNQLFLEAKVGVADAPDFKATIGYTLF
ncbi:MAG: hypothetical protein KKG33_07690 [candidate division Zixibacteria bacterium]|nr:hypothetical protein [candidate division Zixibacteria bacterium]MBU1471676.1 hypothetical protein [candidate division Zixibacteria bacterium]MBU2625428.1 hypothetical protein [candidate division Zixibacteria bacterium]